MYRITVENKFSGAHRLRSYRGSCERLHGHNWTVRVRLEGEELGKDGLLIDFRKVKANLKEMLKKLDHNYLNSLSAFKKKEPTAENIARYIYEGLKKKFPSSKARLSAVRVYESENSWAEYINDRDQGSGIRGQ